MSQNGPKVPSFAQARLKAWLSCHHDTQRANGPAVYAARDSSMPHACHRKVGIRFLFVPLVFQCFFLGSLVRNSGEHRGLESFAKARVLHLSTPTLEDQWHGRNSPSTERRFSEPYSSCLCDVTSIKKTSASAKRLMCGKQEQKNAETRPKPTSLRSRLPLGLASTGEVK